MATAARGYTLFAAVFHRCRRWMIVRDFSLRSDLDKVDEFVCENNRDYGNLFAK